MNNLNLDANRRIDPIIHDTAFFSNDTIQRITAISLPFLNLNEMTGMIVSVGMGGCHTWVHLTGTMAAYQAGDWVSFGREAGQLIIIVSSTALAILFPLGQFVVSNGYQLGITIHGLSIHIWNREWQDAGKDFFQLAHQILHIVSIFYGTPEWIVASLITQAGVELYQAYREYLNERGPEALAHLLLATLRAYHATPHLQTLHRNYFGKELSQQEWEKLYFQIERLRWDKKDIDLESLLINKGISSHIRDIQFTETADLTHLTFKNLHLRNCDFTGVNLEGSSIHRVYAESCLFQEALWIHSVIQNSLFARCNFSNAGMIRSNILKTTFTDSDMGRLCFNNSFLSDISIIRGNLKETNFLGVSVRKGSIVDSDLTDCLFLDTKESFTIKGGTPHILTRPIVGLSWNFRNPGLFTPLIDEALQDNGAIPLRYEVAPPDINADLLDIEVKALIEVIQRENPQEMVSIPQELLKRAEDHSEIGRIKSQAASIFKHCHGISLPGGDDNHPEFYGAPKEDETYPEIDYRRSITEFALLSLADQEKKPVMGTCRGAQTINIYFGGTLKQNIDHHWAVFQQMQLTESSHKKWLRELADDTLLSYSSHHQACDQIGKDLEVVLEYEGIPKLLMSRDGNFIASQIHPEIYLALQNYIDSLDSPMEPPLYDLYHTTIEKNRNFYRYFISKAGQQKLL